MDENKMKNLEAMKEFFERDMKIKETLMSLAPTEADDYDELSRMEYVDKLEKGLPIKFENVIADAGYESEENYMYLSKHNQKSYIKPQNYEKSKNKKFKVDISKRENMIYDEENDYYICAYGNKLVPI